jgi:DNA-binding NarL/FixJ family response regulator
VRVLIVDDQDYICRGLRALLSEDKDIEVCGEVADGREAIAKVEELRPDVVLMDISLPRLDGLEATREIHRLFPNVKVITLSQYEIPDVLKVAMRAGAVTHVPKASVWARLLPALRSLRFNAGADGDGPGAKNIRVLIADDHEVVRRGVRTILSAGDVEVCGEAANGSEAISKAVELRPDLVILDLTMPVMGGFEAAAEIHRMLPKMPILFYSMHDGAQVIREAQRIGARGFVNKGRLSDTLLQAVTVLVVQRGTFFPDTTEISVVFG